MLQSPVLILSGIVNGYGSSPISNNIYFFLSFVSLAAGFYMSVSARARVFEWTSSINSFFNVPIAWAAFGLAVTFVLIAIIPDSNTFTFSSLLFEAFSAITTTGVTFLDVYSYGYGFVVYMTFLSFFGGIGIVLVFFTFGNAASYLFSGKSAGGFDSGVGINGFFVNNLLLKVISVYIGLALIGFLCYYSLGVRPIDAMIAAVSSASTSGFLFPLSDKVAVIKVVSIFLMTIASLPLAFLLTINRKSKKIFNNQITAFFMWASLFIILAVCIEKPLSESAGVSIVDITFNVVSCISTAGFPLVGEMRETTLFIITALTVIGGCSGSTTGGLKTSTFSVAFSSLRSDAQSCMREGSVHYPVYDGQVIDGDHVKYIHSTIFMFLCTYVLFTACFTYVSNLSVGDASFWSLSILTTSGLKFNNFSSILPSDMLKQILFYNFSAFGMLAGRIGLAYLWFALFKVENCFRSVGRKVAKIK